MKQQQTKNGWSYKRNGWTYISVFGKPRERGYAYGYFCANEFKEIQKMLKFFMLESFGFEWSTFVKEISSEYLQKSKQDFHEYFEEMEGIAQGCKAGGTDTTIEEILAWNYYLSIPYWMLKRGGHTGKEGGAKDHCSAFIAVGDWTQDGEIVVAHNSFADFIDGQYMDVILDIKPEKGARIIMQTCPCWIWSGTDFFVTENGIIGTETTIGGFKEFENNVPIMYRIRNAMQYGRTLDDYVEYLVKGNSGDYANSWLFGDTKTNEIMRIELGLKYHNVERTKNGFFIGFNATYDARIRNLECSNQGFFDIRRHQGARYVRLSDLMDENKGKINVDVAKKIISDHYDVYLKKENNACSRTVCSHYDEDAREYMSQQNRPTPFAPHGALDGCVTSTKLAKQMAFWARYGRSCGEPFYVKSFIKEHRQYEMFEPYLRDRPSQPWTFFHSSLREKKSKLHQHKGWKSMKKGVKRLKKRITNKRRI